MRRPVEYRTASRENYKRFLEVHPEVTIPFTEWQNVIYTFNTSFRDHLLETGEKTKLPYGFGGFMVSKKKKKRYKILPDGTEKINLSVNWKATKEAGKKIYHMNHETNGYNFYWKWDLSSALFYQHKLWWFKPSRETSRLLAHYIKQGGYDQKYLEWESTMKY